jgi:hypothetical protein
MLLFREIYGWLRYLVAKDPVCNSQGIVVEEIYSTFAPLSDMNDGVRTLVIHRIQDGMTPRLEYRAIGLHPQVYWYPAGSSEGSLVAVSNQMGFPGDFKSWDCSDFCQWMLLMAQDKFCSNEGEEEGLTIKVAPVTAKAIIDLPIIERIIESVKEATHTGKPFTKKMVNDLMKDATVTGKKNAYDLFDFAMSVMHWFDKGKLSWKEIDYLEDEISPGKDILDWSWLKRQLNTPERLNKLPTPIGDHVTSATKSMPVVKIKKRFDTILHRFTQGKAIGPIRGADPVRFGFSAIASFKNGELPFQYLQQLELCDPYESILPWSFIRRNVLSYTTAQAKADAPNASLIDLILTWLKNSHLLLLLYKGDAKQEESLVKALKMQFEHHIKQTLGNDFWMKHILNALSSENVTEMKRSLQVEFDLWLLDALSPAVKQYKLPLSPHAFSVDQKDQETYNKMYKVWEKMVKEYLKSYRDESGKRLTDAIAHFYTQVVSLWKSDDLANYKAKTPSASKILNAVEKGDQSDLLNVLCEDFENEVGSAIPDEIKEKLLSSPYFNAISREVKLQGMLA